MLIIFSLIIINTDKYICLFFNFSCFFKSESHSESYFNDSKEESEPETQQSCDLNSLHLFAWTTALPLSYENYYKFSLVKILWF